MATTATAPEQRQAVVEAAVHRPPKPEGFKSETAGKLAKRANEENPRTLLEELRQRKPVENPKAQHLIERNLAQTKNPDGLLKRTPEQQRRFDEANRYNSLAQTIIEKGADSLRDERFKLAVGSVKEVLEKLPEARQLWAGLTIEQINQEITQLLKDPDFVAKIREARSEATDESKLISTDVVTSQAKLETTKTKREQAERNLAQNNGERDDVAARLEQFEDRTATGGRKGSKQQELEKLEEEAPDLTIRQEETERLLEGTQARIRDLENTHLALALKGKASPEIVAELSQKRVEADSYRKEMGINRRSLARTEALQREKAGLQERRGQLEQQRIDLENTVRDTNREYSLAEAELGSISLERVQAEEEFVAGFRNILRDATFSYLEGKIADTEQSLGKMLDEEIAQTQEKAEKALAAGIKERYVGKPQREMRGGLLGIGAKDVWVPGLPKTEAIDTDYQKYLESGNPVPLVQTLLENGRDPTTGERLLTDLDVTSLLANQEFIQKVGTRAIGELLKARIKTGEITEDEATIIANHDWGAAAIQEAVHKNPQAIERLEELKTQTGEKDERKLLANMPAKSLLALLLMIVGSAALSSIQSINLKEVVGQQA